MFEVILTLIIGDVLQLHYYILHHMTLINRNFHE